MKMTRPNTMSRRSFLGRCAQGAAVGACTAAYGASSAATPAEPPKRVFIVTIDTLRLDHLREFGYPRATAPFLSRLMKESVVFRQAYSTCNHTIPSHASMLTGLHIPQHRMLVNTQSEMDQKIYTMAEMFRDAGYETGASCPAEWMVRLADGFDFFHTFSGTYTSRPKQGYIPYSQAPEVCGKAMEWLEPKKPSDRFFFWLHLYDPHGPFCAPKEHAYAVRHSTVVEDRFIKQHWFEVQKKRPILGTGGKWDVPFTGFQNQYDAEIHFMDRQLELFYRRLKAQMLTEDSVWIFMADHGEGLGSHDYAGHGKFLYNEQIHVLLMIHSADGRFQTRNCIDLASGVDLMPTVADMLNFDYKDKSPITLHGHSLLPYLEGRADSLPDRPIFSCRRWRGENIDFTKEWVPDPVCCIIDREFKYILSAKGADEFYDIRHDYRELKNLIGKNHASEALYRERAQRLFAMLDADAQHVTESVESDAYREQLEALGYL